MTEDKKLNTDKKRTTITLKLKTNLNKETIGLSARASDKNKGFEVKIKGKKRSSYDEESINKNKEQLDGSSIALSTKEVEKRQKALLNLYNVDQKTKAGYGELMDNLQEVVEQENKIKKEEADKKEKKKIKEEEEEQKSKTTTDTNPQSELNVFKKLKEANEAKKEEDKKREKNKTFLTKEAILSSDVINKSIVDNKKLKIDDDEEEKIDKKKLFKKKFNSDDSYYGKRNRKTFIINDEIEEENEKRIRKGIKSLRKSKLNNNQKTERQRIIQEVILPEEITVSELSDRMKEKKTDVVKKLMSMGVIATINQSIDADTAEIVVTEFGHNVKRVLESDVENVLTENTKATKFVTRAPVVTVMGHVDHGKTSLLDAIRTTDIVSKESGGITQHIGASRVNITKDKFITFIDTPGHEAFTAMRMRGANITDIVILVVAADDGIKEQTIEAINHAKAAKVPIIVAINKIDKPGADPQKVKNELLNYNIVSEDLGGDCIFVEVSAKEKTNLNKLKEIILLQAEMMELKAAIDTEASGAIIESKVSKTQGVIVSLLVQEGILKIGDNILAEKAYGKVRKILDDKGKEQKQATPSMAVEIFGLDKAPNAGERFFVVQDEKKARDIIDYREKLERKQRTTKREGNSIENMLQDVGNKKELQVIIKGDVKGSVEAIINSFAKINNDEVSVNVLHSGTGGINESDVNLASASNAMIIGFNVVANNKAKELSKDKAVKIRNYSIIYNVIDEIKAILQGMLNPIEKEEKLGQAEVRQVIKISNIGKIAGCFVTEGIIERNANVRLLRDSIVVYEGKIKTLKRFKEDAKEVKNNLECGIAVENYDDIKEKDIVECYKIIEEAREL